MSKKFEFCGKNLRQMINIKAVTQGKRNLRYRLYGLQIFGRSGLPQWVSVLLDINTWANTNKLMYSGVQTS